ncbi:MAG: hypothetical protein ACYC2G_02215 [Gemmatimonadaceae bacterium]
MSDWNFWRVCRALLLSLVCAVGLGLAMRVVHGSPTGLVEPTLADVDTMGLEGPIAREEVLRPRAPRSPAALTLTLAANRHDATAGAIAAPAAITLGGLPFLPFQAKRGEYVGAVRMGFWPAERRWTSSTRYANPAGFLVVTPALRGHAVSPHFTVGEFAMHAGARGPDGETYVVLQPALPEKLELTLAELAAAGVRARDFRILSGFRAPHYNGGVEGAAPSSRHQYGDAADLIVDDDGDGRMDDLNGDGRVTRADIYLVADAFERVERRHRALVGGLGLYDATGPSGPFLHVDVRGSAARWGSASRGGGRAEPAPVWSRLRVATASAGASSAGAVRRPGCSANAASAVLCATREELADRGGGN